MEGASAPGKRPPASMEAVPPLKVKKLSAAATLPQRASIGAAGYDLCSAEDATIPAGFRKVVKTDLSVAIPPRHYGRVAPRSGLSFKYGIDIAAGVIDSVRLLIRPFARSLTHTHTPKTGLHGPAGHRHGQQRHRAL